jgi:hypothetical protein
VLPSVLEKEFAVSLRLAQQVLNAAQEVLVGEVGETIRPGQVRQIVSRLDAPFGPTLIETDKIIVTLTLDNGLEDAEVKAREGLVGQRRGRILRLIDEAIDQGGVLTQEDLAHLLQVVRRTIARDVKALKAEGHLLHTRGHLKGVGRGQTHKVRIIELWLDREGYDKIGRWVHHTSGAIKRYVSTFLRVVRLHQKETAVEEIAFLTNSSVKLVNDYLALYQAVQNEPHRQEKLAEELARVSPDGKYQPDEAKKGVRQP